MNHNASEKENPRNGFEKFVEKVEEQTTILWDKKIYF